MRSIFFNYNSLYALLVCLPFCARYLCIMKGEVAEGEEKKHNYCFLWQFIQSNLRFLFSDERFFSFVSLIDFRNNSSLLFAYIGLMNFSSREKEIMVKKNDFELRYEEANNRNQRLTVKIPQNSI